MCTLAGSALGGLVGPDDRRVRVLVDAMGLSNLDVHELRRGERNAATYVGQAAKTSGLAAAVDEAGDLVASASESVKVPVCAAVHSPAAAGSAKKWMKWQNVLITCGSSRSSLCR